MTTNDIIIRQAWIIDQVYRFPGIQKEEILNKWQNSTFSEGGRLSFGVSTFYYDIQNIARNYGIFIESNRKFQHSGYRIINKDSVYSNKMCNWLLNISRASLYNQRFLHLHERILLDDFCFEKSLLDPLIEAIEKNRKVLITHHPLGETPYQTEISPYCIKAFKQSLYVLGLLGSGRFFMFPFEEIEDIAVADDVFVMQKDFLAEIFFKNFFGANIDAKVPMPSKIIIRAYGKTRYRLLKIPLHHSQVLVHEDECFCDFQFKIFPTEDFQQYLLQLGPEVKVLEPIELVNLIANKALSIYKLYKL